MRTRNGFTLIELLVVIAIIAILAAILFPVFGRARDKSEQASCLSNVKQVVLGIQMYEQDYDGTMPLHTTYVGPYTTPNGDSCTSGEMPWMMPVYPYVKNVGVFNCPSWTWQWAGGSEEESGTWNNPRCGGFGLNAMVSGEAVSSFRQPAELMVIAEKKTRPSYYGYWYIPSDASNGVLFLATGNHSRHTGGINVGFADGHAKWLKDNSIPTDTYNGSDPDTMTTFWNPKCP
jgi:prepilin-type N-terminal cleavage/methylation domain-containing protein/prepilin-type processing-associated H-X9-DG protein